MCVLQFTHVHLYLEKYTCGQMQDLKDTCLHMFVISDTCKKDFINKRAQK